MTLYYPPTANFVQKTLAAQLLTATTASATLNNTTSIQNAAGVMIVDRVNTSGVETPNAVEVISFTGTSGATVTTLTRNLAGTTAQDHAVGAVVEFGPDIIWAQGLIDTFVIEHNADGTHKAALVTTLKASSADVTAASSDTKIVTPLALLGIDSRTATFTNKTLTDTTNNVMAKSLKSATTTVDVSAATAPSSGQVLTATASTTATWQTPTAVDVTPKRARVYKDADQTLTTSTNTVISFNQETFDNDTMHDNATNNSRLTATTAGFYLIIAQLSFGGNSTGRREAWFKKNGTAAFAFSRTGTLTAQGPTIMLSTLAALSATDYVEVEAWQDSGGNLAVTGGASDSYFQTHFEIVRLGA